MKALTLPIQENSARTCRLLSQPGKPRAGTLLIMTELKKCDSCDLPTNGRLLQRGRTWKKFREKTGISGAFCRTCVDGLLSAPHLNASTAMVALSSATNAAKAGRLESNAISVLASARASLEQDDLELESMVSDVVRKTRINNALKSSIYDSERIIGKLIYDSYTERRKRANAAIAKMEIRLAVFSRDEWKCKRCKSPSHLTVDHIHAVANGGEDSLENYQTLCRPCNSSKGCRNL